MQANFDGQKFCYNEEYKNTGKIFSELFSDEIDLECFGRREELWKSIVGGERRWVEGLGRGLGIGKLWPFSGREGGLGGLRGQGGYVANARTLGVLMGFLGLKERYEILW